MIDCQQSEENVILAVFPDSIVYLCAFRRLQAWLRWIVNTKNGVSNYQTYCMGLLRAVGDGKTEDTYTKALMELQKSHIWSRFPNFCNYYMQQWAPKKKVTRCLVIYGYKYCRQKNCCFFLFCRCGFRHSESGTNCTTTQTMG